MISFALALTLIQHAPVRVACIGDSITYGIGTRNPIADSYPSQLAAILGTDYTVGNFGNSGTTLGRNTDHSYWNVPELKAAQDFSPDVVVIMLGTNDATVAHWPVVKDDFVPTYKELIHLFQALPSHPKVYACVPVPAFEERRPQIDAAVCPLVRQAAREAHADVIDLYTPLEGKAGMFPDRLHPNEDGAGVMAETVAEGIENPALRKQGWKVISFDSEEPGEGKATEAIDGDPYTYWHTNYSSKETRPPHTIVVDTGDAMTFKAFRYLPRQDGGVNGRVKDFELYLSADGQAWGEPVVKSRMKDTAAASRFDFSPRRARFFKFIALSEQHGGPWASAAELDLVRKR